MMEKKEKKKFKNKTKSCPKDNVQNQLRDLEEVSRSRSRRMYFATCEDEKVRSLCQWLNKVFYEQIELDSKTKHQLPATLSNKELVVAIRVLCQDENDVRSKREMLMHRQCMDNLYPLLFKYLLPSLRKKLKKILLQMENANQPNQNKPKKMKKSKKSEND